MKVVDASVAVKWLINEDKTAAAVRLLDEGPLIAPELLWTEVANALWKKVQRGDMSAASAVAVLPMLDDFIDERIDAADVGARALELALDLDHPVYDCIYLALAERRGLPLVTADARLQARLAKTDIGIDLEWL